MEDGIYEGPWIDNVAPLFRFLLIRNEQEGEWVEEISKDLLLLICYSSIEAMEKFIDD